MAQLLVDIETADPIDWNVTFDGTITCAHQRAKTTRSEQDTVMS